MLSDYFDAWGTTPSVLAVYKSDAIASSGAIGGQQHPNDVAAAAAATKKQQHQSRVEDRLLATEKDRRDHLQAKSREREEARLKECTGRPRIDGRSAALMERRVNVAGRGVVERLTMNNNKQKDSHHPFNNEQQQSGRQQRMLSDLDHQARRVDDDAASSAASSAVEPEHKPRINKHSREIVKATHQQQQQAGGGKGDTVRAMMQWKAERDRKLRLAEDEREQKLAAAATGRPQLNPTSVAIAHNRKLLDGTAGLDPVDDLMRRHQEHEMKMKRLYEEQYGGSNKHQHVDDGELMNHHGAAGGGTTAAASAAAVTERLCKDAMSRRERREQQQLAAELLSYIDPVTGEVLFQPNVNKHIDDEIEQQQQQQQQQNEDGNDDGEEGQNQFNEEEVAAALLRQKHQHRHEPGFWDRLSRPSTAPMSVSAPRQQGEEAADGPAAAADEQQQDTHHRRHHQRLQQEQQGRAKSPSISQYSRLLADIHRRKEGTDSANVYDRLSKPQPAHSHTAKKKQQQQQQQRGGYRISSSTSAARSTSRCPSGERAQSTATNNDFASSSSAAAAAGRTGAPSFSPNHHQNSSSSVDRERGEEEEPEFRPHLNQHSKMLDPRRNERGMTRIEGLFQKERDRQRMLEQQQLEKQQREEEELRRHQLHQPLKQKLVQQQQQYFDPYSYSSVGNNSLYGIPSSSGADQFGGAAEGSMTVCGALEARRQMHEQQEAFADRQAAWEARRRQKVQAKQAQKQDREVDDCTFQPRLAAAPGPAVLMPRGF